MPDPIETLKNIETTNVRDGPRLRRIVPLAELERLHILRTIEQLDFNKAAAAKALGISKTNLYLKLSQYRKQASK